ncbi:flavin-containing monooxygenase [Qipengyuania sphaerica]|uniref:flavin-containing monooxygenase n=1 Tax=Qipengyuania sphaerica TaxID=2867243 RepID=UPI001C871BAD|nr:NAD(P)/FAD-dependent oxidoreductase [Qipengyuania sphaerica]MBX7539816.1 NAD(P)/FAD-dependent oxidoreductase [Qipengyuania sphaerica]
MGERPTSSRATDFDVLIVGAGISGIGMAAHMKDKVPDLSFAIVERREQLGGTWDLFRYPGIRSDSDMHTLGFEFEPWKHEKSIADGPTILEYLNRIVDERDIRRHMRFGHKVVSADWREAEARWHITLETDGGERKRLTANWLHLGSGYYDYDKPYDAGFDFSAFDGEVVHPQFWPEDLDYSGKRVVVIGSGATAVTLVPAMTDKAAHVTMLQRTPTWMVNRPAKDKIANTLRKVLPEKLAYRLTRFKNITLQQFSYRKARSSPEKVIDYLKKGIRSALGEKYDDPTFTPPYNPWEQRLCLVPDADLFEAMKAEKAEIVTGHIAGFEQGGVRLKSGELLPADIIVTATGLQVVWGGKIAVSVGGQPVDFSEHYFYKNCMLSNLPNTSFIFPYLAASYTLRADLVAGFVCRVLDHMRSRGDAIAVPVLDHPELMKEEEITDFSSGYLQRSLHLMPKNSAGGPPWYLSQDYYADRKAMRDGEVEDGLLIFRRKGANARAANETLETAT